MRLLGNDDALAEVMRRTHSSKTTAEVLDECSKQEVTADLLFSRGEGSHLGEPSTLRINSSLEHAHSQYEAGKCTRCSRTLRPGQEVWAPWEHSQTSL